MKHLPAATLIVILLTLVYIYHGVQQRDASMIRTLILDNAAHRLDRNIKDRITFDECKKFADARCRADCLYVFDGDYEIVKD